MKRQIYLFFLFCITQQAYTQCVGTPGQVSWQYWEEIYDPYGDASELTFLYADDTYPLGPDNTRVLNSVSAPANYKNNYASLIKGFISVPTTEQVTFNITGDDLTLFFLSSDATKSNLDLDTTAYVSGHTGLEEYNKYSQQTSSAITMIADQLYYFEIHHKEGSGGDFATLRWQRPYVTDSTWTIVTSPFLTDVCDTVCPQKGTPCDDSNAATNDDVEDGSCHCIGQPDTTGFDVGERGVLDAYFYDDTGNGNISELTNPKFPAMPDRLIKQRTGLYIQWEDDYDDYACFIQGYFTVPETGLYDFNLTGTRNVEFRFNSNGSGTTTNQIISTRWGTHRADHEDDPSQTITNITLTAGTYYYFEVVQAVVTWGHNLNVFWKVPDHVDDDWHMIPPLFLYDYTSELACLPLNASCDDGDPLTANDRINASCDCVGTPCTPFLDCDDPAAELIKYDYCEISNSLGSREDDAWLSCDKSNTPPNPIRAGNHWIHYDLGALYVLQTTRIWNYNVSGNLAQGFQNVIVDYSVDGENWTQLGTYSWSLANGDNTYTGFDGPDFGGVTARYVIFTSTDSGTCRGISKVSFSADSCESEGKDCDDGDIATVYDKFDANCNCIGLQAAELNCGRDTLYINRDDITPNTYHAVMALMSDGSVLNSSDVNYRAGAEIVFDAGFEVELGGSLTADIEDCTESAIAITQGKNITKKLNHIAKESESLQIFDLEGSTVQTIRMYLPEATVVSLEILDMDMERVVPIASHRYSNHGDHYKRLQTKKLKSGVYFIMMKTDGGEYLEKMIVMDSHQQ